MSTSRERYEMMVQSARRRLASNRRAQLALASKHALHVTRDVFDRLFRGEDIYADDLTRVLESFDAIRPFVASKAAPEEVLRRADDVIERLDAVVTRPALRLVK